MRAQLQTVLRKGSELPVALLGAGDAGEFQLDDQRWRVVPVRSELELRGALLDADPSARLVLLVDHDLRLPLDLACRLAGQRVHSVDRRTRLATMFGARKVEAGLERSALAEVLLQEPPEDMPPISGTVLRAGDAWRRFLHLHLPGLPIDEALSTQQLLRVALVDPEAGPALRARRDDAPWERLLDEAQRWVELSLGAAGRQVWSAWLGGHIVDLGAWLVHVDAALRADSPAATAVLRTALRLTPSGDPALLEPILATPLREALAALLDEDSGLHRWAALLQRARVLMDDEAFGPALKASPWLPEGLAAMDAELAACIADAPRGGEALALALDLVERIGQHRLIAGGASEAARHAHEVRLAAVRLANWMAWIEHRPLPEGLEAASLPPLAAWYDDEGAWVDHARGLLRQKTTGHAGLDVALQPLLAQADRLRRDLDRRFAQALLKWHAQDKPGDTVVPIEDLSQRVLAPFLRETPTRRLLVIVLDGMSVPIATRIAQALEGWETAAWAPGRLRRPPPAIAALPTLTATSRAALFAGKALARHGHEPESLDPERFAANTALQPFAGSTQGPRLFLRAGLEREGMLHPALQEVLRDPDERVVAVVLNAIDDQLKGSDQITLEWDRPQTIPLLTRLLRAARDSGRAVLLTSDHGHVPAVQLESQPRPEGPEGGGRRYRPLARNQAAVEGELELPEGCWRPRRADGLAAWWDERRCWGSARTGAHGGLSMAEVVVPLRLLTTPWLHAAAGHPDDGLRTSPLDPPAWWRLLQPPRRDRRAAPPPQPARQLSFLSQAPAAPHAPAPAAPTAEQHPVAAALSRSPLLKALAEGVQEAQIESALRVIDLLLKAPGGRLPLDVLARRVGTRPHRLSGIIANMGFLNADGIAIVEHDAAGRQVVLYRERLTQQYGLADDA